MHTHDLARWTHDHVFHEGNPVAERGVRLVLLITLVMMIVEIAAGWVFNSMALLADGWHMASHTLAIGLSAVAYAAARRFSGHQRFAFGTWKLEVLGGYTSALFLLVIAGAMVYGSIERMLEPRTIHYTEALPVAAVGLVVNVVCAWLLARAHGHDHHHDHAHPPVPGQRSGHAHDHDPIHGHDRARAHDHGHDHRPGHEAHDLNLRAAYLHVLADAVTSMLAIVALVGGWFWGWGWLDPAIGIVGAIVVSAWALGLLRATSRVLLDSEMDLPFVVGLRAEMEKHLRAQPGDTRITDLHLWRVGREHYACILSVVTHDAELQPNDIKAALRRFEALSHVTVEINRCH